MPRIDRAWGPVQRDSLTRRRATPGKPDDRRDTSDLALLYSNGFVTVEISHDALDAYMEMTGDVPLPIVQDRETGDRRTYDARHQVRAVYNGNAQLREVSTRNREGLFVRINFSES